MAHAEDAGDGGNRFPPGSVFSRADVLCRDALPQARCAQMTLQQYGEHADQICCKCAWCFMKVAQTVQDDYS